MTYFRSRKYILSAVCNSRTKFPKFSLNNHRNQSIMRVCRHFFDHEIDPLRSAKGTREARSLSAQDEHSYFPGRIAIRHRAQPLGARGSWRVPPPALLDAVRER